MIHYFFCLGHHCVGCSVGVGNVFVSTTTEVNITDLQWDDKTRTFTGDWSKLRSMPNFPMPDSIKVYNHQTQREVTFKERVKGSARYASNDLGYTIYLMLI